MQVVLVFGLMALFILANMPVAFALGVTALVFLIVVTEVPLVVVAQRMYMGVDSFTLLAVPLFILTGVLMNHTRLARKIVDFALSLVGFLPGGLAVVNIVTSMFFAGVSGTAMADTAAVGGVLIPAMKEKGYKADFAGAVTASSSTVGIIIPPSVPMVLYGVFVGVSVSTLFIAGIMPGILIGLALIGVAIAISVRDGYVAEGPFSLGTVFRTFSGALPALVLPLIILGGIMGGVFTPTEAAGVAVVYVVLVGAVVERDLTPKVIYKALKETVLLTGTVMIIISIAELVGWVFSYARIPMMLVGPFLALTESPFLFLWIASFILIIAGTFLHGTALLVVLVPLFLPTVQQLGIHSLHFAMVVMMCWGIGQQTPPVGSSIYITCTLAEIDIWELTRANLPFFGSLFFVLGLVIHLPDFTVFWVPRLVGLM